MPMPSAKRNKASRRVCGVDDNEDMPDEEEPPHIKEAAKVEEAIEKLEDQWERQQLIQELEARQKAANDNRRGRSR